MKIAHLSDSHLGRMQGHARTSSGRNQRQVDFETAFVDSCKKAALWKPDLVIHAGDAFDNPRPVYPSIRAFIDGMRLFECPSVVIGGNHDTARMRLTSSVFSVCQPSLPETRFVTGWEEEMISVGDVVLHLVPWGRLMVPTLLQSAPISGYTNVLVSHGDVPTGAFAQDMPGKGCVTTEILTRGFDYVALGHIHIAHTPWPRAWYSGPGERCGWSDAAGIPGFLQVELFPGRDPIVEHVQCSHRPFFNAEKIEWQDHQLPEILEEFDARFVSCPIGAWARLEIAGVDRRDSGTIRRYVEKLTRPLEVSLKMEMQAVDGSVFDSSRKTGSLDFHSLLKEFIEERRDAPGFPKDFHRVATDAIVRAEAENSQE